MDCIWQFIRVPWYDTVAFRSHVEGANLFSGHLTVILMMSYLKKQLTEKFSMLDYQKYNSYHAASKHHDRGRSGSVMAVAFRVH